MTRAVLPLSSTPPLGLSAYLRSRLRPLAFLVLGVLSMAAPAAYLVMGTRTVHEQAVGVSDQLAAVIGQEIRERPLLWRYDANKLQRHLDGYLDRAQTVRAVVSDGGDWRIEASVTTETSESLIWAASPIEIGGLEVAHVWVGASSEEVKRQAIVLLLAFLGLGGALAGMMYWLPLRAIQEAEQRIEGLFLRLQGSQAELAGLNENLEQSIADRSAELRDALADLQAKERALRELSARAAGAQEAERRALSRELHDSAAQALTAIRINLQILAAGAAAESETRRIGEQTMQLADTAVDEIRRVVDQLAPAVLDDMGLPAAIERSCQDFAERTGLPIDCRIEGFGEKGNLGGMDSSVETACYRVIQEGLTNVARHANANSVKVRARLDGELIRLFVADDGIGCDPATTPGKGRRGLAGMRERVALFGGKIEFETAPGRGATLSLELPLPREPSQPQMVDSTDD